MIKRARKRSESGLLFALEHWCESWKNERILVIIRARQSFRDGNVLTRLLLKRVLLVCHRYFATRQCFCYFMISGDVVILSDIVMLSNAMIFVDVCI